MFEWKRGWKALAAATALVAVGCAHGPPPRELLDARAAYEELATSPEGRERPQEVAEAREALLEAEREFDRSKDSPRARSLAYVALRKAETAEARGSAELAARQQAQAEAQLREARARQRQRVQAELEAARQQLAQAEAERQAALQQQQQASQLAQTQQAEAERLRQDAQRRREEAEQLRAQAQQRQAEARRLAEETARLQAEAERRQQAEAEAQRLARQNQELQQRAAQLEAERQAQARAEQERQARLEAERQARARAEQRAEEERQARVEAEKRATEALTRLDAAARDVKVRQEARGTVVTLSGSVLFASNAVDLLPAARDRLSQVAEVLKETKQPLLIEGHTDSQGPDEYNEDLSYRRAERVREFLISRGVPAERIDVRGLGEYRPVASNVTPEGRANNRRVEIVLERGEAVGGGGTQQQAPAQQGGTGGSGAQQQAPEQQGGTGGGGTQQQAPEQQGGTGGNGAQQDVGSVGSDTPTGTSSGTGGSGTEQRDLSGVQGGSGAVHPKLHQGSTPPQPGDEPAESDTEPPR